MLNKPRRLVIYLYEESLLDQSIRELIELRNPGTRRQIYVKQALLRGLVDEYREERSISKSER